MNLETELFQFEEGGPELKYSELSPEQKWKVDDKLLSESSELFQFEEGGASLPYSELNQEQKAIVHSKFDMSSLSRSDTAENTEQKEEQGFSPLRYMRDTAVGTYNAARRGFYDTAAGIEGNIATVADDLGFEGAADYLEDSAKRTRSYGESIYQPKVQSYKDIDSFSALDTYLGERLGMAAPSIALYANPAGGTTINAISAGGNIAIDENFSDQINTTDMVVKGGQSALLDLAGLKGLKGFQWAAASPVASGLDQIATNLIKGDDALVNVDEAVAGGTLTSMAIKAPATVASAASATTRKGRDVLSKGLNKVSDLSFVDKDVVRRVKGAIEEEKNIQKSFEDLEAVQDAESVADILFSEIDEDTVDFGTGKVKNFNDLVIEQLDTDLGNKVEAFLEDYTIEEITSTPELFQDASKTEREVMALSRLVNAGMPLTSGVVKGTPLESKGRLQGVLDKTAETASSTMPFRDWITGIANLSMPENKLTAAGKTNRAIKVVYDDMMTKLKDKAKYLEGKDKSEMNAELDKLSKGEQIDKNKLEKLAVEKGIGYEGFDRDLDSYISAQERFKANAAKEFLPESLQQGIGSTSGILSILGEGIAPITVSTGLIGEAGKSVLNARRKATLDAIIAELTGKKRQRNNLLKMAAKAVAPAEKNSYLRQARKLSQEIARLNASRDQLVEE